MNKNRFAVILAFVMSLAVLAPAYAQAQNPPFPPLPLPHEFTSDTLHWLGPSQAQEINSIAGKLDSDGLSVIFVVTQNDCGPDSAQYKTDLFRTWRIGHYATNDGLLIMVCWYGGDKSRRGLAQETGTGLEATITDIQSSQIAKRYFVPAFQGNTDAVASGRAGLALVDMVKAYDALLRGKSMPVSQMPTAAGNNAPVSQPPAPASASVIAFLGFIGACVLVILGFVVKYSIKAIKKVDFKSRRTRIVVIISGLYVIGTYVLFNYNFDWGLIAVFVPVLILMIYAILKSNYRRGRWDNNSRDDSTRSDGGGGTSEGGGSVTKF
jgi:uncharacterized membrane protein YgcG